MSAPATPASRRFVDLDGLDGVLAISAWQALARTQTDGRVGEEDPTLIETEPAVRRIAASRPAPPPEGDDTEPTYVDQHRPPVAPSHAPVAPAPAPVLHLPPRDAPAADTPVPDPTLVDSFAAPDDETDDGDVIVEDAEADATSTFDIDTGYPTGDTRWTGEPTASALAEEDAPWSGSQDEAVALAEDAEDGRATEPMQIAMPETPASSDGDAAAPGPLEVVVSPAQPPPPEPPPTERPAPTRARHPLVVGAGLLAACAVAAVVTALALWQRPAVTPAAPPTVAAVAPTGAVAPAVATVATPPARPPAPAPAAPAPAPAPLAAQEGASVGAAVPNGARPAEDAGWGGMEPVGRMWRWPGSYALNQVSAPPVPAERVTALAETLRACGSVVVTGHTCTQGNPKSNEAISLARAESVREALIQAGLAPERVRARGAGSRDLLREDDSPASQDENRRVIITCLR